MRLGEGGESGNILKQHSNTTWIFGGGEGLEHRFFENKNFRKNCIRIAENRGEMEKGLVGWCGWDGDVERSTKTLYTP